MVSQGPGFFFFLFFGCFASDFSNLILGLSKVPFGEYGICLNILKLQGRREVLMLGLCLRMIFGCFFFFY